MLIAYCLILQREGLKWKARSVGACVAAGLGTESPTRRGTPNSVLL